MLQIRRFAHTTGDATHDTHNESGGISLEESQTTQPITLETSPKPTSSPANAVIVPIVISGAVLIALLALWFTLRRKSSYK
jgi:hypothetical protein